MQRIRTHGSSESTTTRSRPKSQISHTARFDSVPLFTQSGSFVQYANEKEKEKICHRTARMVTRAAGSLVVSSALQGLPISSAGSRDTSAVDPLPLPSEGEDSDRAPTRLGSSRIRNFVPLGHVWASLRRCYRRSRSAASCRAPWSDCPSRRARRNAPAVAGRFERREACTPCARRRRRPLHLCIRDHLTSLCVAVPSSGARQNSRRVPGTPGGRVRFGLTLDAVDSRAQFPHRDDGSRGGR